jgi:dTDP-4-dehydrorhamnose 3,5-epimerase
MPTFTRLALPNVILVEPEVFGDERGFFLETWHRERWGAGGIDVDFVQTNHSRSVGPVLRGLHAQRTKPQGKLVRCVEGEIFDVAVDIRPSSPTFGRWVGATLSAANRHQLWVPAGFAHGFCVVGDAAQVEYACTALYDREDEIGVRWNDPAIGITWPITEPTLSPKDRNAPTLAEIRPRLLDP